MRERPILFSAPMVRAILEGRKTQTRRVLKPKWGSGTCTCDHPKWASKAPDDWHCETCGAGIMGARGKFRGLACPYGAPGDRLWVREAFRHSLAGGFFVYRADPGAQERTETLRRNHGEVLPWTPPIHMPRGASRITLEITDVRVERLQDISEADALAEGVESLCSPDGARGVNVKIDNKVLGNWIAPRGRDVFETLWEHINGPGSWAANPWVWVIEFAPAADEQAGERTDG